MIQILSPRLLLLSVNQSEASPKPKDSFLTLNFFTQTQTMYSEDLICLVRGCFLNRKQPLTKQIRSSEYFKVEKVLNHEQWLSQFESMIYGEYLSARH